MKVNRSQALYRYLPNSWTTYSDPKKTDYKYACQIMAWNTKAVTGINDEMIRKDILLRIKSFYLAGGEVGEEFTEDAISKLTFVEAALNDPIPDIVCKINPTTYYCPECNNVVYAPKSTSAPECFKCHKRMNQLQMVYACECGFAEGVRPNNKGNERVFYHSKEKENQFKFFTANGTKREMIMKCPMCGKILTAKNATDTRLFYSQSGNLVDLYNKDYVTVLKKYGQDAEILMIAKWFDIISHDDFLRVMEDPKKFFEDQSKDVNDPEVIRLSKMFGRSPEEVVQLLSAEAGSEFCIANIKNQIDKILPLDSIEQDIPYITSNLLEYDTLKNPKEQITLEQAIKKGIEVGEIIYEDDVNELIDKLHIKNIQVSEAVQIVNYAYGFTRLHSCPDTSSGGKGLHIRGFDGKVFTNILDTEGILVNIDLISIYDWLVDNEIISGDYIIDNELDAKKWFMENIDLSIITHFSDIPHMENCRVTKAVYSLLHTISHMMIISAGRNSGLSKDSISELIFPNAGAIFIYPTSSEGVTLGSISGMFETKLNKFLEDALKENEICTFDPVCSTSQNGACVACTYLSEVNCTHFNKDLSRLYLYGGTIKLDEENKIEIKKGFWR